HRRALEVPTDLPDDWEYVSCWTDSVGARTLNGATYASGDAMTASSCASFCGSRGFKYAGTEYAAECWCGNALAADSDAAPSEADCDMACSGDATQPCGGSNRLTLFENAGMEDVETVRSEGVGRWSYIGCYT
ncbi:WSC domain-containing protein, partial [Lineolata rhizophorae]